MKLSPMRDKEILARQYNDSTNLDIRKNFHKKYSVNPVDYQDWLLPNIQFVNGCRVLEVGCGTGSLWENNPHLLDTFSELILTDISPGMVDIAKGKYVGRKNIHIQVMDVLNMPFETRSFDVIVANSMLYHVEDIDVALKNIHRVLRDDGAFYATTGGKGGLLATIHNAVFEMGLSDSNNVDEISFALENGGDILRNYFSTVKKLTVDDRLEVSDPMDLVDYIFSMATMGHIDRSNREKMCAYFASKLDHRGVLTIPKRYGIFIAVK